MDIVFRTTKLRKTFNQEKDLIREYGPQMAKKLKNRIAVLSAASNLALVPVDPPLRRHELEGDLADHFAVDLVHPRRLIFRPAHNPVPRKPDGGIDVGQVTAIEIVDVRDYH